MTSWHTHKYSRWWLYRKKVWSYKKYRSKFPLLGTSRICRKRDMKWLRRPTWIYEKEIHKREEKTGETLREKKLCYQRKNNKDSDKKTLLRILRASRKILCWTWICTSSSWYTRVSESLWDIRTKEPHQVACRITWIVRFSFCTCDLWKKRNEEWMNQEDVKKVFRDMQQTKVDKALKDSWVSPRFRSKRLADLSDSPGLQKLCLSYVENWNENKKKWHWLYFFWDVGRWKTHTSCAISNELIDRYLIQTMFVNIAEIASRVRKTFDEKSEDSDLFDKLKTCELLVIDDMGTEKISEWIEEQIFIIINYRYEYQLPVIITSNYKISDLKYKKRIMSRLSEMTEQIGFTSMPDRRLTSKTQ